MSAAGPAIVCVVFETLTRLVPRPHISRNVSVWVSRVGIFIAEVVGSTTADRSRVFALSRELTQVSRLKIQVSMTTVKTLFAAVPHHEFGIRRPAVQKTIGIILTVIKAVKVSLLAINGGKLAIIGGRYKVTWAVRTAVAITAVRAAGRAPGRAPLPAICPFGWHLENGSANGLNETRTGALSKSWF
jgi:hypothetical protein